MRYKVTFLLMTLVMAGEAFSHELKAESSHAQFDSWVYDDYRMVAENTRTLWFVDYYDISHLKSKEGDSALLLTFTPEKLTQGKVTTATIEALEESNPGINMKDSNIQKLVDSLSIPLIKGDVIAIIYRGEMMQIQYNNDVVYQAKASSKQSVALRNIWLGETPVDDLL